MEEAKEGSAPVPPRIIALISAVIGQKGGLGEPFFYDLVVGERTLWAVPLRSRLTVPSMVKAAAANWAAPGAGGLLLRRQIAENLQHSQSERWALYVRGESEQLTKSDSAGLIIALDEIQGIKQTGFLKKYIELRLPRATYYFQSAIGRTEEILVQLQAAIRKK